MGSIPSNSLASADERGAGAGSRRRSRSEHVEFLESFVDSCRFGDYLFVHAGIRPGSRSISRASPTCAGSASPFLLDDTDHGFVVVHGHTIADEVEERPNRIGIDTGAYRTGVLTALAIEGTDRWLLDTRGAHGAPRD